MPKADFSKYDYVIFVDASGDDGTQFENGSSLCFTTACFISEVKYIADNKKVLDKIKHISGRLPDDELKHSTLRRHRMYLTALNELLNLKGCAAVHNSFKKDLLGDDLFINPSAKLLSSFTHYLPLYAISKSKPLISGKILICIDRMKDIEMDTVKYLIEGDMKQYDLFPDDYEVIFTDSKAYGYELIQIADVMAGIWRIFFEESATKQEIIAFLSKCRYCWDSIKKSKRLYLCSNKSVKLSRSGLLNKPIKYTLPLIIKGNHKSRH